MRFIIPRQLDRLLDLIALLLFPSTKSTGLRIAGRDITWIEVALVIYTLALAFGLWWFFGHWFWFVATIGSMVMAAMIWEWFF